MKLAASALFAFALLAGNTGCRLLNCGVPCGCDGFADDCGGCATSRRRLVRPRSN